MMKIAFFQFDASSSIGAGHAIRSCAIADALGDQGWLCKLVTRPETYEFIPDLNRFERIDPETFWNSPSKCDLLVIDNYNLDYTHENHFRPYAKKIMVIDDLANRKHDCDILIDQAESRDPNDYRKFVPNHCKILTGRNYVLLRKEFICLRSKALEKRRATKEIKRILISMGGGDQRHYTLEILKIIKGSSFKGSLDIVLGFSAHGYEMIKNYADSLSNECTIHVNPDMAQLTFEADLAIGAAGSSVWERCCLGLPNILVKTAENQTFFLSTLRRFFEVIDPNNTLASEIFCKSLTDLNQDFFKKAEDSFNLIDAKGIERVLEYV